MHMILFQCSYKGGRCDGKTTHLFDNSPFKCFFERVGSTQVTAKDPTANKNIVPVVVIFVLMAVLIILAVLAFVKGVRVSKGQT